MTVQISILRACVGINSPDFSQVSPNSGLFDGVTRYQVRLLQGSIFRARTLLARTKYASKK